MTTHDMEVVYHLREYVSILAGEPAEHLIPVKNVYHDLKRILGDE